MFCTFLWNFEGKIGLVDNFLPDTVNLVSENKGVAAARLGGKFPEFYTVDSLLHGDYRISFRLEFPD